jgi:hypothetical protein
MLSLEAEGRDREGLDRSLQKRVNGFLAFGHVDRTVRRGAAVTDAVDEANAADSRDEHQRRQLGSLELGVVAAAHRVRPLATPLDEAQMAPRELVEGVGEQQQAAARIDPGGERLDDRRLVQRPVSKVGIDEQDRRAR